MELRLFIIKILNLFFFLSVVGNAEETISSQDRHKNLNSTYTDSHSSDEIIFGKKYDLFMPKYDFQRPYKFRKEQYSKLVKYASDYKRKLETPQDVYIMSDDLIQEYEEIYRKEILYRIINKEVNLEEVFYDKNFDIYAYPDLNAYREQKPKFILNEDHQLKNYDNLGNFLKFSHKKIEVVDKPICIATMVILNIANIRNENIIIKGIRSDLFQAAIFIPKGKEMPHSYNQKNLYPKILAPEENFSLQVIVLPDMVGRTIGNIYFELADNKVIVFPLEIKAVENIYKVNPIYVHNWQGSKLFISNINLYNPHPKTLIIKEVINSFSSINLIWPNGQPVSSNHTSVSSSMLEVPSKSNKNILQINFYKDVPGVEYGLLQLKTDRDTLIIPVVVGVEVQVIRFFPNFYNFGVIDVNRPIKRLIPISLSNLGLAPVQIKSIYSSFEENLIEFIPNLNNFFCNFDLILSGLSFSSISNDNNQKINLASNNPNSYTSNICIINRIDNMSNFGFLMIDPTYYKEEINGKYLNKKTRGSIIIQTNFTDNPFIELIYEYYLDKNTLSFEKEPELYYNSKAIDNPEILFKLKAIIKPPFYTYNKDIWKNTTEENPSQLVSKFDTKDLHTVNNTINMNKEVKELDLDIKIINVQSFQNKKNYFIPVKLNVNMITLFPFKLYDRSIELHYCDYIENYRECLSENYSAYKSVNFKSQTINIDFGLLTTSEAGKKYFNLINDNGENIQIKKVESDSPLISMAIESIEDINTNKKIANNFNKNFEIGKNVSIFKKSSESGNEDVTLIIPAESYLTLSIIVNSPSEQNLNGSITIHFSDKIILTINVHSKFLKGNLNITPSVVRFEPAFPGLFQSKLVSSKSSYNIPINIHSIKSFDQRIIPVILTNSIISNNRTEILKVIFDPSKVEIEENFMRGDTFSNSTSKHLTYKELYLWKEKQKLWEILGSQGRTEINTIVKIKTNIQTETVNVRGFLTKPSLVKKDELEFGLVQLGESNTTYIEVFNPSDEPMSIQILLAPEEYSDIHNNSMFFNNKQRLFPLNNITILECSYFNISNFIDQTSQNFTQNFINNRSRKRNKKKGEDPTDTNVNSILLEEEISNNELNQRVINKNDLLKKIFLYTNVNTKLNFLESERIICNTNFFKKNEIIFNNNKELIEKIFSEEFMKEIIVIKRMTERNPPSLNKIINRENNLNIFEKIAQSLKLFFKTEVPQRKKRTDDLNLNNKQEFFLPKALSSQVFVIKPHQKTKIGPIVYSPSNHSNNSTATLFIKNNLTVLYPIKLKGHGGTGVLNFFLIDENIPDNKNEYTIKEEKIEKLIINFNNLEEIERQNNQIKKVIKIKNTGNLPVKVSNLTVKDSGCEGYGIKLGRCDGFYLYPQEHMKLEITIIPDFNFYYLEKEIFFETLHQSISIKVLITISDDILSEKNRLINFDNIKNYGVFSFSGSCLIIFVILIILKKEKENDKKTAIKNTQTLSFVNSKELIEKTSLLKFENLFIKAYRKNNRAFYEEFFSKHMDAPSKHEVENLISEKKRKKGEFKQRDDLETKNSGNVQDENAFSSKENKDKTTVIEGKDTNKIEGQAIKDRNVTLNTTTKKTTDKKIAVKKPTIKKQPIGISQKTNDKKDDEKKTLQNILNSNQNNPNNQNLLPGSIYQQNNKYEGTIPYVPVKNINVVTNKDDMALQNEYFNNMNPANWGDPAFYQMGFWPKNFPPPNYANYAAGNVKRFPQSYDYSYNQGKMVYNNSFAYPPNPINPLGQGIPNQEGRSIYSLNPNNPSYIAQYIQSNPELHSGTPLNPDAASFTQTSGKFGTNNLSNNNNFESNNPNNKSLSNYFRSDSKEEKPKDSNFKNMDFTGGSEEPKSTINTNIKEQFMSFVPGFFVPERNNPENKEKNNPSNLLNMNFINPDIDNRADTGAKDLEKENLNDTQKKDMEKSDQQGNNLIGNFKMIDFTNYFNQNQQENPENDNAENSENEDNKYANESENDNDFEFNKYRSDREKIIEDSGTEDRVNDFKFNFNSIFGGNNNMKLINPSYNDFNTDNEEPKQNFDGNKPYFDKNIFFSFDSVFNNGNKPNSSFFNNTTNLFSGNAKTGNLLSELRDDETDNTGKLHEEWEDIHKNKLDDVAEIEDDDDEEDDPLWNTDNVDINKEGFFDASGNYKLKQMDFNFNLDFNPRK